jgi:hypothetical protein
VNFTQEAPRGAIWAAELYLLVSRAMKYVLVELVDFTKFVLRERPYGPDDCKTPQELRAYAYSIRHSDPGFSQDLLAAVDRHTK